MSKIWRQGLMALSVAVSAGLMATVPMEAEAKRLGSGRSAGIQRQMPAKQPTAAPDQAGKPAQSAQQQNAATPQAAPQPVQQAGKRSWMGPIAGLAAGLGLAALASHFGFGDALANVMTMALIGILAVVVIGWLMRRFAGNKQPAKGPQFAGAGAPYSDARQAEAPSQAQNTFRQADGPLPGSFAATGGAAGVASGPSAAALAALPADFDRVAFERAAKMIFIRMQAVNDEGNVEDLRKFTTPELFAALKADLLERGAATQQTDVMSLEAELIDAARESGLLIVSVRFHGQIREEIGQPAEPFDEVWHLQRPLDGHTDWAIAGIQPVAA